jgi:uncharacterized membrane protein (DUF485 family)
VCLTAPTLSAKVLIVNPLNIGVLLSTDRDGVWAETQNSPEFQSLRKSFRGFAFPLTVAFLVWYFLYVVLTAWAREWVSTPVVGSLNIAFFLGVLQFATTFLIMWLYERHSSHKLDGASDALRDKVNRELGK